MPGLIAASAVGVVDKMRNMDGQFFESDTGSKWSAANGEGGLLLIGP